MARPKKDDKYIQAGFKLPKELLEALDSYVEKNMENRSIVVRKAIYEYLIRHGDGSDADATLNALANKSK